MKINNYRQVKLITGTRYAQFDHRRMCAGLFDCVTIDVTHNDWVGFEVIRSFRDKDTEALFLGRRIRRFESFVAQAERRLQTLDSATCLEDLAGLPSNRLEGLAGDRKGQYSIRINKKWRVCFEWREDGPYNVEIVDYH